MSHEENAVYPVPETLKVEECRMPFIGPLKGACPGLCPQKARRHSFLKSREGYMAFPFEKIKGLVMVFG